MRPGLQKQTRHKMIIDPYAGMRGFIFSSIREPTGHLMVAGFSPGGKVAPALCGQPPHRPYFVWRLRCARAAGVDGKSAARISGVR